MPKISLTERYVASMKASPGGRLEISDAGCAGLCLRITGLGSKVWALRYRAPDGRQSRHRLGDYPTMSLRDARLEAGRLRDLVHSGGDPVQAQREARQQARQDALATFGKLLGAYWTACETGEWQPKRKRKRAATLDYEMRLARRHIEPVLGETPVSAIKRSTVKDLLRGMAAKGIGAQTNRVQAVIRQVFNYAISEELAEVNPAMGFTAFHSLKPRRRIWKDAELRALWAALTGPDLETADGQAVHVGRRVRIALQLALLLLQRRGEIAGMDLEELDLDQAVWLIPGERMKSGRPHQVPLPPYSIQLIREAIALARLPADRTKGPVFPSPLDHTRPMNPEALTRAMDRLRDCIGIHDATVHDLRRTGSTALTSERLRVPPFIRSKVLGHETDAGGGAAVSSIHYDANEYMSDKRAALSAWESLLFRIVRSPAEREARSTRPGVLRTTVFGLVAANDENPFRMDQTFWPSTPFER